MPKWKMIFLDILGKTNDHRVNNVFSTLSILVGWSSVIPNILHFTAASVFGTKS
jgi:hypothetical protein